MKSPLRIFTLEYNAATNSVSPHVRYISPDNVLQDLYKVLNCQFVTCMEIEINGKFFDVYSDEEGKPFGLSHDDVQLLWDFALAQFSQESKEELVIFNTKSPRVKAAKLQLKLLRQPRDNSKMPASQEIIKEGTPYEGKLSCTVWSEGKGSDYLKEFPITISRRAWCQKILPRSSATSTAKRP